MQSNFTQLLNRLSPLLQVLYLSISGALCVLGVQAYMHLPIHWIPALPSIGIIFSIYTLNRYTDCREDLANDPQKSIFFNQHRLYLWISLALMFITYFGLITTQSLNFQHVILLAIGLLYSLRLFPWLESNGKLGFLRIKDIPILKNLVVSLLWGSSIFVIPLESHGLSITHNSRAMCMVIALCLSTWSNTFFNDIRDMHGDALAGTKTLAIMLGKAKSILLIAGFNSLWFGFLLLSDFGLGAWNLAFMGVLAFFPVLLSLLFYKSLLSGKSAGHLSELDLAIIVVGLFLL